MNKSPGHKLTFLTMRFRVVTFICNFISIVAPMSLPFDSIDPFFDSYLNSYGSYDYDIVPNNVYIPQNGMDQRIGSEWTNFADTWGPIRNHIGSNIWDADIMYS